MRKASYTEEDLAKAVRSSFSLRDTLVRMNMRPCGQNYPRIKSRIEQLDLDTSHWKVNQPPKWKYRHLKPQLGDHCYACSIKEWQGNPLTLHIHHKDGNRYNNRLENLELLCPNCHSQTPNYCKKKELKG